jgi:hypothetical protein
MDNARVASESPMPAQRARSFPFRLVAWLRDRFEDGQRARQPARIYYQFESGAWRSRSTRQLNKVCRCR